jgi:CubicO group peptidase (beta-lactamase class C family)
MAKWLQAALHYIPSWLEFQLRASGQPGCSIAVAYRGRVVLERAFGLANCQTGEALTPRHCFRVASHSKCFTAAGIMKLRELGKLRLNDSIAKYVAGLHPRIARASISQVLSHGVGIIRDGDDCSYYYDRRPFPTADELLGALKDPPLIKPNTRFKYSNLGFGLLGLVIEATTGAPYTAWIKREIVDAIGLRETMPDMPIPDGKLFAQGHTDDLLLGKRAVVPGDYVTGALTSAVGCAALATGADERHLGRKPPRNDPQTMAESSFQLEQPLRSRHAQWDGQWLELVWPFGRTARLRVAHQDAGSA